MTAREIAENALKRLGYTGANGNEQLTRRVMAKVLDVMNDVYFDLWEICKDGETFSPLQSLSDEVDLSHKATRTMVYGVCMFLAQSENDGDQQQLWASMFNNNRAGLSQITERTDVLPTVYGGM